MDGGSIDSDRNYPYCWYCGGKDSSNVCNALRDPYKRSGCCLLCSNKTFPWSSCQLNTALHLVNKNAIAPSTQLRTWRMFRFAFKSLGVPLHYGWDEKPRSHYTASRLSTSKRRCIRTGIFGRMLSGEIDVLIELMTSSGDHVGYWTGMTRSRWRALKKGDYHFGLPTTEQVVVERRDADRQEESQLLVERYFRPHFDEL